MIKTDRQEMFSEFFYPTFYAKLYTNNALNPVKTDSAQFTMRKLVLGIIALVAVQFAFVTYTMLHKSSPDVIESRAIPQPVLNNPEIIKIDETSTAASVRTEPGGVAVPIYHRDRKKNLTRIVRERTPNRQLFSRIRTWKPAFARATSNAVSPASFAPIVIRYNRMPDAPDCEPREVLKPKKPIYTEKSTPVKRKPWWWLKAIASRLN